MLALTKDSWFDKLECVGRVIGEYLAIEDGVRICMSSMERYPFMHKLIQGVFGQNAAAFTSWVQKVKPHHSFDEVVNQVTLGRQISSDANYFHLFHALNIHNLHRASKEISLLSEELKSNPLQSPNLMEHPETSDLIKAVMIYFLEPANCHYILSDEGSAILTSYVKSLKNIEFEILDVNHAYLAFTLEGKDNIDLKKSVEIREKDLALIDKMLMTHFNIIDSKSLTISNNSIELSDGSIEFLDVLDVICTCIDSPVMKQLLKFLEENHAQDPHINPMESILLHCCNQALYKPELLIEQLEAFKSNNTSTISVDGKCVPITLTPELYTAIYCTSRFILHCLNQDRIGYYERDEQYAISYYQYFEHTPEELRQEKSISTLIDLIRQLQTNNGVFAQVFQRWCELTTNIEKSAKKTALSPR